MSIELGQGSYPAMDNRVKKWLEEEQRYLLDHHEDMYIEDIASVLNKSVKAVENKAQRMGCSIKTKAGNTL